MSARCGKCDCCRATDSGVPYLDSLAELRIGVEGLASSLALSAIETARPVEVKTHGEGKTSEVVAWWRLGDPLDIGHQDGTVFLSATERGIPWRYGTAMQYRPDWYAARPAEAREIGIALLAAARAASLGESGIGVLAARGEEEK